ncbi:hypothetical protein LTR09_003386 [Extremus antarcticus]|uniref:Uncharacterized protein n=1 Tax=Extremus antarcticus TaxID=702011 RepID=A0AAJ0DRY5_9PEZI|nr:hypothetical protein LTR09_003386 [Extremus antarcticus]
MALLDAIILTTIAALSVIGTANGLALKSTSTTLMDDCTRTTLSTTVSPNSSSTSTSSPALPSCCHWGDALAPCIHPFPTPWSCVRDSTTLTGPPYTPPWTPTNAPGDIPLFGTLTVGIGASWVSTTTTTAVATVTALERVKDPGREVKSRLDRQTGRQTRSQNQT